MPEQQERAFSWVFFSFLHSIVSRPSSPPTGIVLGFDKKPDRRYFSEVHPSLPLAIQFLRWDGVKRTCQLAPRTDAMAQPVIQLRDEDCRSLLHQLLTQDTNSRHPTGLEPVDVVNLSVRRHQGELL